MNEKLFPVILKNQMAWFDLFWNCRQSVSKISKWKSKKHEPFCFPGEWEKNKTTTKKRKTLSRSNPSDFSDLDFGKKVSLKLWVFCSAKPSEFSLFWGQTEISSNFLLRFQVSSQIHSSAFNKTELNPTENLSKLEHRSKIPSLWIYPGENVKTSEEMTTPSEVQTTTMTSKRQNIVTSRPEKAKCETKTREILRFCQISSAKSEK